jgi:hypothetical protein
MGLRIEDNWGVHNLLFADDEFVITRGVEDATYIGRKLEEEYGKWDLKVNYGKMQYYVQIVWMNCKSVGIQFQL